MLSGQRDRRRGFESSPLTLADLARRRPASPLSQVHTAPSSRPSKGGCTSAQVNANLSHPPPNNNNTDPRISGAMHSPSSSKSESNYSTGPSHGHMGSLSSSDHDQEHEHNHASTEAYASGNGLARSKSIVLRIIASPALPESRLIDNERNMGHTHGWSRTGAASRRPLSLLSRPCYIRMRHLGEQDVNA